MPDYTPEQRLILDKLKADFDEANAKLAAQASTSLPAGARMVGSAGGYWNQQQGRMFLLVPPGEILTQYGTSWFRAEPRFEAYTVQVAVSMLKGQHSKAYAARKVTRMPPRNNANVRYFRTDDLWLNGYTVYHAPSEHNELHISVYFGNPAEPDQLESARASWADPNRVTLDALAVPAGEAV